MPGRMPLNQQLPVWSHQMGPMLHNLHSPLLLRKRYLSANWRFRAYVVVMSCILPQGDEIPALRKHLIEGDFFTAASLASSLSKMVRRLCLSQQLSTGEKHRTTADCIFILASICRYGSSTLPQKQITADDLDRVLLCIRFLSEENPRLNKAFVEDCGKALAFMLQEQAEFEAAHGTAKKKKKEITIQPDDPISFNQLVNKGDLVNGEDVFETSLSQAIGFSGKKSDADVRLSNFGVRGRA